VKLHKFLTKIFISSFLLKKLPFFCTLIKKVLLFFPLGHNSLVGGLLVLSALLETRSLLK
jgi:hypothetical protein